MSSQSQSNQNNITREHTRLGSARLSSVNYTKYKTYSTLQRLVATHHKLGFP